MSPINFAKAEFASAYGLSSQLPASERPEFVFSGRSNVGKSSLINKLCNRKKLARISGTPGKTATINFYSAGEAYLVDLPGYGYAKIADSERRRWDNLINGYFEYKQGRNICLLVQLLDCRHAPSEDDFSMLEFLQHHKIPFVVALTKADKFKPSQYGRILAEFSELLEPYNCQKVFLVSTLKNTGIEELAEYMKNPPENLL